jgi:tetratricopeptide (TPR) repeat protein
MKLRNTEKRQKDDKDLFARISGEKAKKRNKIVFITLVAVVVIGAIIASGFIFTQKPDRKSAKIVMSNEEEIEKTNNISFEAYNIAEDDAENGYQKSIAYFDEQKSIAKQGGYSSEYLARLEMQKGLHMMDFGHAEDAAETLAIVAKDYPDIDVCLKELIVFYTARAFLDAGDYDNGNKYLEKAKAIDTSECYVSEEDNA